MRLYASAAGAISDVRFIDCIWAGAVAKGGRLLMDGPPGDVTAGPTRVRVLGGQLTPGAVFAQGPGCTHVTLQALMGSLSAELWKGSASHLSVRGNELDMDAAGLAVVEMLSGTEQTRLNVTSNTITGIYAQAVDVDDNVTGGLVNGNDFDGHVINAENQTVGTNI
ncbi:hypothetical protein [Sagittula sp. NFXS13]|uniref:hypothetical protein n=1 Tax=Sagittula sp. NFXS13 TaxID=2819095 RepID=UPI0032DF02E9